MDATARVIDVAARYAGLVLQFRGATLDDVYDARKAIELHRASYVARWGTAPEARKAATIGQRTHERFLDEAADDVLRGTDAKTVLDLLS